MIERALSAGGKLFVAGEYAVLWGGVARVACVTPRVHAMVCALDDRRVDVSLREGRLSGVSTPVGVRWSGEVTAPFHVVARAVDLAYRVLGRDGPGISLAFEPSPSRDGHKLGFGSSARAAVLAAEAARWALGLNADALKLALVAHADAQGWKGSGGDVAACFAGGLVRYRRYALDTLRSASVSAGFGSALQAAPAVDLQRVADPMFPLVYAFSGSSASTPGLIGRAEQNCSPAQRAAFVVESDALGDQLEVALTRGDFATLTQSCAALQERLSTLAGTQHEGIDRLLALAHSFGCAGKQSGAGGGDGVVLFAPDIDRRAELLEGLRARGIFALALELSPGVRGDAAAPPELREWLRAGR